MRTGTVVLITATALTAGLITASYPAAADPKPPKDAASGWAEDTSKTKTKLKPSAVPPKDRKAVLGDDYQSTSDRVVTVSGDGAGLHVLTGKTKNGYDLKTAATLYEAGFASDTWIGNHCVTESGKYAAVAYAPRMFTNKPELMARGAFAAVVNLDTGKVTKLPFQASLAYFSPGCGNGEKAVFSQMTWDGDDKQQTRLITVDATTGKTAGKVTKPGQVTSAIPTKDGIVAAHGNRLVRLNGSKETELTRTKTVPFELRADADGGVTFIDRDAQRTVEQQKNSESRAAYLPRTKVKGAKVKPTVLAAGKLTEWDLTSSADGKVFITGKASTKAKLPAKITNPGGLPKEAHVSTRGRSALTTAWSDGKTTLINPEDAAKQRPARVSIKVLATGKKTVLDVTPGTAKDDGASPALPKPKDGRGAKAQGGTSGPAGDDETGQDAGGMSTQMVTTQAVTGFTEPAVGDPNNPSEKANERTCAVPRNDVKLQAFQPTPRQIEWAVDQAVVGELNLLRGSNWKNTGVGGYSPQSLFPPILLAGDPNGTLDNEDPDGTDKWHIPAQVMLGITAQESNMWQATRFAVPGVTANSLIGNYYGVDYAASGDQNDPWRINWFDADCGYGVTQATDGMRLPNKGQETLDPLFQKAIAVDYTANIAAGVQILSKKWNETYNAGMKINGGHPKWIENWFFALWAYNSGFYPTADSAGHKGVGWTNNPANPLWDANRVPFLQDAIDPSKDDYSHAAHPQDWPYQEKVIGWAARPISAMFAPGDFQAGYRPAWWLSDYDRARAKPPVDLFCSEVNFCDPSKIADGDSNDPGQGACMNDSGDSDTNPHWLHCWWDAEITSQDWKNCETGAECGNAVHRFNTSYGEQADASSYPPRCTSGLDANALIVDDVADGVTPAGSSSRGCGPVKSDGTFTFDFIPWQNTMERPDKTTLTMDTYPGKVDTHQIGAGYGNHFWFTHTRSPEGYPGNANRLKVQATWKLKAPLTNSTRQAKVFAHIPDHGAQTGKAVYRIQTPDGEWEAPISQKSNQSNKWVSLGAYNFGDQIPEVRLDNFNGGTGDADIAFDAIAFVPGTYNGMNMGSFSEPDPNAPAPGEVEPPNSIDGRFFYKSPALTSSSAGTTTMSTTDSSTYSCSTTLLSMKYDRTDACIVEEFFINQPATTNSPAKEAKFNYKHLIHTNPKTKVTTQEINISLASMKGATRVNLDVDSMCRGYCSTGTKSTIGTASWTTGDTHLYTIKQDINWTGTGTQIVVPHWEYRGSMDGAPTKSIMKAEKDDLTIRCDNEITNAGAGCVFSWYKPTYVMNSKKFPGAAAHIALMWKKTNVDWGNRTGGKSLTYLGKKLSPTSTTGETQADENRRIICKRKWRKFQGTGDFSDLWTIDAGEPRTDGISCDEYAFANARESAGNPSGPNPVNYSGAECVQTYIKRNSDGTSSIHLRPDYPDPTWNEPCGRSSMSTWQNTQSMQPFGDFIKNQRLMEDDKYWVDLDGFTL